MSETLSSGRSWMQTRTRAQLAEMEKLTDQERGLLLYDWPRWARHKQKLPPGEWSGWLVLAGRGFGKTKSGSETVRQLVESGRYGRLALIAETAADCRDVLVEGDAGILAVSPPWFKPLYESSKRRLTWPNGAIATLYNGTEPDQLRGPSHDFVLMDELAKYRYAQLTFDMMLFGLRLGKEPRWMATTTPRPIQLLRDLIKNPAVVVTRGSSRENLGNLSPNFRLNVIEKYAGTRLGRQELDAEVLEDVPGALWELSVIDEHRVEAPPCDMARIVVAIDPAAKSVEGSAEHGLVVVGLGVDGVGYVLEDLSFVGSPDAVVTAAVAAYRKHRADRIIAEVNNGGEWIEAVLRSTDRDVSYRAIHASRGKITRAEPVAALYEKGRVSHVGVFPELEDQMITYSGVKGDKSPDRLDACVWAITELMLQDVEVYDMPVDDFLVTPFMVPDSWPRAYAMSVLPEHTSVVWMTVDLAANMTYLYTEFLRRRVDPAVSAAAVNARGKSVPGMMVRDTTGAKSDADAMIETYQGLGLSFALAATAGEADIAYVADRLATGRLKVFSTMQNWVEQFRRYRRGDGLLNSPLCVITGPLVRLGGQIARPVTSQRVPMPLRVVDRRAGY